MAGSFSSRAKLNPAMASFGKSDGATVAVGVRPVGSRSVLTAVSAPGNVWLKSPKSSVEFGGGADSVTARVVTLALLVPEFR